MVESVSLIIYVFLSSGFLTHKTLEVQTVVFEKYFSSVNTKTLEVKLSIFTFVRSNKETFRPPASTDHKRVCAGLELPGS